MAHLHASAGASVAGLALFAFAAAISVPAAAVEVRQAAANGEEMLFADDPKDWAKPKVVIAPKYPDSQLSLKAAGRVDVDVTLKNTGEVASFRIAKSEPSNPAFEKAVEDVVQLWLFHYKLNKECIPIESSGNVRVWFDVVDGKGTVSVSGAVSPSVAASDAAAQGARPQLGWLNRKEIFSNLRYPAKARRENFRAEMTTVMRIDAMSGKTIDIETTWIETRPAFSSESVKSSFRDSVKDALMIARFAPRPGPNYRVCVPFSFRMG